MGSQVQIGKRGGGLNLPGWVPDGALHYLAHTEKGQSIRSLARTNGCHASTVMRQIRKVETQRDDPLVDAALKKLAEHSRSEVVPYTRLKSQASGSSIASDKLMDEAALMLKAPEVLRRLCEPGAVLAVAAEMEKAVVVRDTVNGATSRTAVVDQPLAQAMALKEWIAPRQTGRVTRYEITSAGRELLNETCRRSKGSAPDGSTDLAAFDESVQTEIAPAEVDSPRKERMRYALSESPLVALSRRRDTNGKPFLTDAMVYAGERLREDFEMAQTDGQNAAARKGRITSEADQREPDARNSAAIAARSRVATALAHLGPGLSDVVLQCCCYLEGLETTEKRLGWSARSGKVVLRIALLRLQKHYEETIGTAGPMIG